MGMNTHLKFDVLLSSDWTGSCVIERHRNVLTSPATWLKLLWQLRLCDSAFSRTGKKNVMSSSANLALISLMKAQLMSKQWGNKLSYKSIHTLIYTSPTNCWFWKKNQTTTCRFKVNVSTSLDYQRKRCHQANILAFNANQGSLKRNTVQVMCNMKVEAQRMVQESN